MVVTELQLAIVTGSSASRTAHLDVAVRQGVRLHLHDDELAVGDGAERFLLFDWNLDGQLSHLVLVRLIDEA